jgi:hypothetical protein
MTTKEHLARHDKHDREIAAIRKLVLTGMKMLVRIEAAQKRTDASLKELAAAQKATEASLKAFIDTMRGGGNGHAKGKVNLR